MKKKTPKRMKNKKRDFTTSVRTKNEPKRRKELFSMSCLNLH